MNKNYKKGFGVVEILIVLAILALMSTVVLPPLYNFKNQQVLKNTTEDIITLINKARMETLASKNSHYYSVHFASDRAVLFTDGVFNQNDSTNYSVIFDNSVSIPSTGGINLSGGGSDLIFNRLTGDTDQNGTIVLQLNSDTSIKKTITIRKTGIVTSN